MQQKGVFAVEPLFNPPSSVMPPAAPTSIFRPPSSAFRLPSSVFRYARDKDYKTGVFY
jgi:hypothetical protein